MPKVSKVTTPDAKPLVKTPKRRIFELDLLRGFFICVIILDHLQFWPSPLQYLTGQGRLWVSAAEGFFLISGLLIGYLRAYKGAKTPLRDLSRILLSRAAMLYLWCVIITFVGFALASLMPGDGALLPKFPTTEHITTLPIYIWNVITMNQASDWIYFLRLYAIMLAVTPMFLWLLRKGHWLVALAISVGLYAISFLFGIDDPALQWQVLFFGAALIGWKFEAIMSWLRSRPRVRLGIILGLIAVTLSTMVLSYFMVHGWKIVESTTTPLSRESYVSIRGYVDPWFSNNPMMISRLVLSFVWFAGLLALFHVLRKWLLKYAGWLLLTFGQGSLTAYCLQAIALIPIVTLVPFSESNYWLNGLIGIVTILFIYILMRIPLVQKILPR